MKKPLCILALSAVLLAGSAGLGDVPEVRIDSISFTGIDSLVTNEIIPLLLSREGGILNEGLVEYDTRTIADFLRENGWWNAAVTASVDSAGGGTALDFKVDTGKPVHFGRIEIKAGDGVSSTFPPDGDSLYGTRFSRRVLEEKIRSIVSRLAGNGYPEAEVTPSFSARGDTVDVALNLTTGRRASIDSIAVHGLTRTKDYVVRRELNSLLGRPVSAGTVGEARELVERMGFVRLEDSPAVDYDDAGRGILVVRLGEKNQGTFDGVIGYQPVEGKNSGEIVGKIDMAIDNMFGTGRSGRFRWQSMGKGTEDLEVRYTEPWIFGFPYDVSGAFLQEERETLGYIKTAISGSVGRHIGNLSIDGGGRYEKVSADSVWSSSAAGIRLAAAWSAIDRPANPSRGVRYGVDWSLMRKRNRFRGGEKIGMESLGFDFDNYVPVRPRQTLAVLLRYRRVEIPLRNLGPADRYWLGGTSTIRGYGENIFPAVKALWLNIEYRYLTGDMSRIFAFIDTGHLINRERTGTTFRKTTRNVTGYGFGFRIRSRAGVLGFDYGLGKGDSPGEGKLHVSLRTEF